MTLTGKISLTRLRLDSGGYVSSGFYKGRYFGTGAPVYEAQDEDGNFVFIRASDRNDAKRLLKSDKSHHVTGFYR